MVSPTSSCFASERGVRIGLYQPGLTGEQSPGLSERFMGITRNAIASYLISLYFSRALTPDALVRRAVERADSLGLNDPRLERARDNCFGQRDHRGGPPRWCQGVDRAQAVAHTQDLRPDWHRRPLRKTELLEEMPPWQGGGNMISDVTLERTVNQRPPARFEAGTGNIADAVGLGTALEYLSGSAEVPSSATSTSWSSTQWPRSDMFPACA